MGVHLQDRPTQREERDRHRHHRDFAEEVDRFGKVIAEELHGQEVQQHLDGALQAVPRPDTFPQLNKVQYGLKAFSSIESGGFVWTRLDGQEVEADTVLGDIAEDFDALALKDATVFECQSHQVNANWKLIMDAFL